MKVGQANFAAQLVFYFAVVVVQVNVRRITGGTLFSLWDGRPAAKFDRLEWSAMFGLIGLEDSFEV